MSKLGLELYKLDVDFIPPREQIEKIIRQYGKVVEFSDVEKMKRYFAKDPAIHTEHLFWPETWELGTIHIVPSKFVYNYMALQVRVEAYSYITTQHTYPVRMIRVPRIKLDPYVKRPRY